MEWDRRIDVGYQRVESLLFMKQWEWGGGSVQKIYSSQRCEPECKNRSIHLASANGNGLGAHHRGLRTWSAVTFRIWIRMVCLGADSKE